MAEGNTMPHKLSLDERRVLTMSGVTEVVSFDENRVVLKTELGLLMVHGKDLQLKNLSLDGGLIGVEGHICALMYEESRKGGTWRRLLG